jgi:succinate-semialdehyde dehydrogenase/glutarate-semialdehyde dehydrogenase
MSQSINPSTGLVVKEYADHSASEVDQIIQEVHEAQREWRQRSVKERSIFIGQLGLELLKQKEKLGKLCSEEMGKLLTESVAEVEKCALCCRFYAENADKFLADESIKTEGQESFITYKPLGTVLAVMPWNFPFWQVIRFAAPTLCAGNAAVLKHASNVPGCAMALEEVFIAAGLPKNIFRTLMIPSKEVNRVISHQHIHAVTLTGSTKAGREVAKTAGFELKKTVLELGGSDPYLILKDANLAEAAKILVKGRLQNAGQSCVSPKRIIVVESVYKEFTSLVEAEMKPFKAGDPFALDSKMGPMARTDLRDELHTQVEKSIAAGARCLMGGQKPAVSGAFYPPTLLIDIRPGMPAFDEEMFGPVMCLIPVKDEAMAVSYANQSEYGLGGGIFSQDVNHAKSIASQQMETGGIFINDFLKSDPRLPFGGIKHSGHGRELSHLGIKEFVNAKTVYVK